MDKAENFPDSIYEECDNKMNLNNEKYSRSNWNNNYSQINNQSFSNLFKSNDYYPIIQCENCQKLMSQNDNTQSEIGKLKSDNNKLNNQYKLEIGKLNTGKDYLIPNDESFRYQLNHLDNTNKDFLEEYEKIKFDINKCKLEIRRVVRKIKYFKSNNEYMWTKYNKLNVSNKHYLNKNKVWKLHMNKSKISKYNSEQNKMKTKNIELYNFNYCLRNEIEKFGKRVHCLKSKNEILHKFNNDKENLKLQLVKYESDINQYQSEVNKLQNEIKKLKEDINNLESDNDFLIDSNIEKENLASQLIKYELNINEFKLEICSHERKNEKCKLKCSKYKLEINKLKYEIENLKKQKDNLISENKVLHKSKIENENLKSQLILINNETEIEKYEYVQSKYKSGINEDCDPSRIKIQNINGESEQNFKPLESNRTMSAPIGFENSNANCFLNCVVQQFYSCKDFRNQLIKFHNSSQIANSKADNEKKIFVNNFCKLMEEISKRNERKIQEYVSNIQKYFKTSSTGDDVHKCFMNILTVVSDVTNKQIHITKSALTHTTPQNSFEMYRNQNEGFVFDLFYGQIAIKLVCTKCNHEFPKRFQIFKSISLPVPKTNEIIPLENVIKNYLTGSPVDTDDNMNCQCPGGSKSLFSLTEFTHMPSYLFIYLNRGSFFENGEKNNTFISCNEIMIFPTGESSTKYRLISVIDHIGDNYGGHYYAKSCFETDQWWILNDSFVNLIEDKKSIVTKQAIVFLFKQLSE